MNSPAPRPSPRRLSEGLARLPEPDADQRAHSLALIQHLRDEIAANGGHIGFDRYMQLALYAPGLGYYSAGSRKFGAAGDFVTAPELSPLFSRSLARQVAEVLAGLAGGDVLEAGGGSGVMAADLLAELERLGQLPARYLLLEASADLRQRQRETLAARVPHLLPRVTWLESLPSGLRGVLLANELLDALPVQRFRRTADGVEECGVTWQQGRFAWHGRPFADPVQAARAEALGQGLAEGYTSELGSAASGWIASLADSLSAGVALFIDYGYPRREYYHPERRDGTLMCYYRHRAHADPFVYPGLQDITAFVDFTALAEAAVAGGLDVLGYNTQGLFLLACGITELAQSEDPHEQARLAQQIRSLTLPGDMGERFKVLALGRDYHAPLRGFALQDLRGKL